MINCLFNQCFIIIYNDDTLKKHHQFFKKFEKHDDICEIFAYAFNQMINKEIYDLIII